MIRMFIILVVAFAITIIEGCKGTDLKPFPVKEVYTMFKGQEGCYISNVISTDPIVLSKPLKLVESECPDGLMGIEYSKIGETRNWIKEMQDLAKKNCQ